MWESPERNCLVKREGRQRYTPREKGVGILLNEEEPSKETVKSFITWRIPWTAHL